MTQIERNLRECTEQLRALIERMDKYFKEIFK